MRFREAAALIPTLPTDLAVLLLGPPGVGKSQLARRVGESMGEGATVVVRDLSSHLPEDLLGLPYREDGSTKYAPPAWLSMLSTPDRRGVLLLDDLAAATASVQVAAFQLVLERRSGDCVLSDDVRIIATANRRDDKSGASVLPAALRNRCCILTIEPDLAEWCTWVVTQQVVPEVPAFLRFRPALFSQLPKDADQNGAFGTPRSWCALGRALRAHRLTGQTLVEVASGLVGTGGVEFAPFCGLRATLPDPRSVLMDPHVISEPPSKPDVVVALATALAEEAARTNGKEAKETPARLLHALDWISRGAREYAVVGIQTFLAHGGQAGALVDAAKKNRQTLAPLLKFLGAAISP